MAVQSVLNGQELSSALQSTPHPNRIKRHAGDEVAEKKAVLRKVEAGEESGKPSQVLWARRPLLGFQR